MAGCHGCARLLLPRRHVHADLSNVCGKEMNILALALCFLFVFCPPRHRVVTHRDVTTSCQTIKDAYAAEQENRKFYNNGSKRDDFVKEYPADQQRRVLK